jgi:hypothetical protein
MLFLITASRCWTAGMPSAPSQGSLLGDVIPTVFQVKGTLGGKNVAALVPEG